MYTIYYTPYIYIYIQTIYIPFRKCSSTSAWFNGSKFMVMVPTWHVISVLPSWELTNPFESMMFLFAERWDM